MGDQQRYQIVMDAEANMVLRLDTITGETCKLWEKSFKGQIIWCWKTVLRPEQTAKLEEEIEQHRKEKASNGK